MSERSVALVGVTLLCVMAVVTVASGAGAGQGTDDEGVRLPDEEAVVAEVDPGSADSITVFLPVRNTDDPERRARDLAAGADLSVDGVSVRTVDAAFTAYVGDSVVEGGELYRTTITTDLDDRTGVFSGRVSGERLAAIAPPKAETVFVDVPSGVAVRPAEKQWGSLWSSRYEIRTDALDGPVTYQVPVGTVAVLGAVLVGSFAVPYAVFRRRARSVAARDAPLADRVHALRVTMGNATMLAPVLPALGGLWFGSVGLVSVFAGGVLPAGPAGAWWTVTVWFVSLGPFALLAWLGSTVATCPVYRELLDAEYSRSDVLTDWVQSTGLRLLWYWVVAVVMLTFAPRILAQPVVGGVLVGLLLAVNYALSPVVIRLFNDVAPVTGDLREAVTDLCEREGVSLRGVYRLDTGDEVSATGLVTGVVGYHWVFLTDDLVDACDREEVTAVLAHELGHLAHHHLVKRVAFAAVYWSVVFLGYANYVRSVWTLVFGGALFFHYGLGWIGFRQEYEADAYAASVTSPDRFVAALERVASVNHQRRDTGIRYNLAARHPSFEDRIARIREASGTSEGSKEATDTTSGTDQESD